MTTPDRPEFATNDPENGERVADAIKAMLAYHEVETKSVAIASPYFNVGGWALIADELRKAGRVRLMLGAEPQRQTDPVVLRPGSVPATRAAKLELASALEEEVHVLAVERDLVPFTEAARGQVTDLVAWLRSGRVEVRRYTKDFLHGKAFVVDDMSRGVIAGSSNFTYAGLARSRELNLGHYSPGTVKHVVDWFDGLWADAEPFDLAGFYEQQLVPVDPWLIYLRMLWEAYGAEVAVDETQLAADPSMRDLLPFQKDGVGRARRILEKHNGVLIADEVGLGKTYVGGALVKDTVRARQRVLVVAPKIIRDSVWKPYVDAEKLAGWVDVISYDDLLAEALPDGRRWRLDVARDPDEYALVLLDEAHTVRNSDTGRAKKLIELLKGNPRKRVVLLTATPVNNALGDLHSLLSYFIVHDDEFAEIGIPSLAAHFRAVEKLSGDDLTPEHLFDVLDAVAVRRTRRFVRRHYSGQRIEKSGDPLVFPEPQVRRVDYRLDGVLDGFFDTFAHALGADRDADEPDPFYGGEIPADGLSSLDARRLTLAGYTPSRYRLVEDETDLRQRAAEVTVAGLLRSGLLKRFESSGYAFCTTCRRMAGTLTGLLELMDTEQAVASGESLRDWVRVDTDDPAGLDDWRESADWSALVDYQAVALRNDIENDIALLNSMADEVEQQLTSGSDPKLAALTETLVQVLAEGERDTRRRVAARGADEDGESRERDDRKVLVFSYFADTVAYLQDNIENILADDRLAAYRGRVAFVAGNLRDAKGRGAEAGGVDQDQAVAGFAPKTGGPRSTDGTPLAEDRFDLLVASDVLSEGVNLQQAHNIINFDLPWNPMRLVQRHGRVDRIGSDHEHVYLWCFFPDDGLDRLLGLETILHRKLNKAVKSIGQGKVLPGVDHGMDVVFNAKQEQIKGIAAQDNALFLGEVGSVVSGEELRAEIRRAVESESLKHRLEAMPWGVGSGFATDDRSPGLVFCARVLDREGEPHFRFVPLPQTALLGSSDGGNSASSVEPEPLPPHEDDRIVIDNVPVDVFTDSLTALTMARPPSSSEPAVLPTEWLELAYRVWDAVRTHIAESWNGGLDGAGTGDAVPAAARRAVAHLAQHSDHRAREDVDRAMKVFRRGQAPRVTAVVRAVMRDEGLTEATRTDRLIELVDELGLAQPDRKDRRFPIGPEDVHLIAWTAIVPPQG